MNNELKTKWVEALRSGDYAQTKGTLKYQDVTSVSYCCLGVLCDVAGIPIEASVFDDEGMLDEGPQEVYNKLRDMIPDREDGSFYYASLMSMNDGGSSFNEIADYIEKGMPTDEASIT